MKSKFYSILADKRFVYLAIGFGTYSTIRTIFNGPTTKLTKSLKDNVVVITGPTAGVGKETALDLLYSGATVIFACRDTKKAISILDSFENNEIRKNAHIYYIDLSDLSSVKDFSENFKKNFDRLDILINNAGGFNLQYSTTADKIESTVGVNHVGHVVLTNYLLDIIEKSNGRIINVSSNFHKFSKVNFDDIKRLVITKSITKKFEFNKDKYSHHNAYSESKLGNILFTNYLAEYLKNKNSRVKVVSLHPGFVDTEFYRPIYKFPLNIFYYLIFNPILKLFSKTVYYGAQTTLHTCYMDEDVLVSGGYYMDCALKNASFAAVNKNYYDLYMQYTKEIVESFAKEKIDWKF